MPPRLRDQAACDRVDREWRELALEQMEALTNKVQELHLEIAIMKVKFGFAMLAIGTAASIVTTVLGQLIIRAMSLK